MAKEGETVQTVTWERRSFRDSLLQKVEREAIASFLYEILMSREKPGIEHEILVSELMPALENLYKAGRLHLHFVAFPACCLDELCAMANEGMIEVYTDGDDEERFKLVPGTVLADMIKAAIEENLASQSV